jgi:pimeloyl-ACP methyl ester carboxylesterase
MASTVEGAGVELAYEEHGSGPPLVLIHGIGGDRFALPVVDGFRVIRYDRRGYGDSSAPEPYAGTTVNEQTEDAAALVRAVGAEGAVVVGHEFGALVALDLAVRHGALVHALVVSDPPLFAFVPEATEELSEQRRILQDAMARGGPDRAVEAWLGDRVDEAALARAKASHRAFFADYAGLASWPVKRADLRGLALPVTVLTGPQTPWHVGRAAEAIGGLVPGAVRREDGDVVGAVAALRR